MAQPPLLSEEATPVRPPDLAPPASPSADIRSARPYFLSGTPLRAFARRLASISALVFLDVSGLALGLYAALVLRELYYGKTPLWGLLWEAERSWLPFIVLVALLVFWQAGLYAQRDQRAGFGRVLSSLVLVAVLTVAFAIGSGHEFNTYTFVPTALVCAAAFVGLFRATYESFTRDLLRLAGVRRRALLVGEGEALAELRRKLGSGRAGIGYDFVAAVGRETVLVALDAHRADELIMSGADLDDEELLELVEHAHRRGVKVKIAPTTAELLTRHAEYLPGQTVPLFELRPPVFAGADWVVKRAFDLTMSVLVVVVGLPLWLAISAAIKLTSAGPVLYRDTRVGLHERPFGMFKFRTMVAGADELQPELESRNEADGALFKIRDDPRVTRVGAVLRRYSLDEIPQVLNLLRGEMSLVGPRPLPLRDYAQLEDWHRKRYLVLPGMTGLWQIGGRSELTFDDLVRLDFYYLENWSIWLDVSILAKTLPAVLARRGAY